MGAAPRPKADDAELDIEKSGLDDASSQDTLPRPATALTTDSKSPPNTALASDEDEVEPHRGRQESVASYDSHQTVSDEEHSPTRRERSRAQSSIRREMVRVPRSKRRGLLAQLTLVPEVTNPYDYPYSIKWFITFIAAVSGTVAPMGSSIILPALVDITKTFDSTATVVNLSIALYMLSMSIFPLWWSSFSETFGRRTIYLTSFLLFMVFNVLGGLSTNVAMFIVSRILTGGSAASVQAVGAGTVADIFEVRERGLAMGLFYLGPLMGPLLSPIIGGAMADTLGWRSIQWFLVSLGGFVFIFVLFALPETLKDRKSAAAEAEQEATNNALTTSANDAEKGAAVRPALTRTSTRQSVKVKSRKYLVLIRRMFVDPLRIVLYLQFPAIAIVVAYSSVTFSTLYVLNISVQQTFSSAPYNYGSIIVGLLYLPNSAGYFLTSILGGRWIDRIMRREAQGAVDRGERQLDARGRLPYRPEDRMKENAWIGVTVYPLALIVYGWCAKYGVNIAAPMVANFFFGAGSMLIFAMFTTMLTEFMPRKASNGVALNNFVRNIFSCIGTVVAEPLIVAIGNGWLFTGLAVIAMVSGYAVLLACRRYGNHWRIRMDRDMERVMGE